MHAEDQIAGPPVSDDWQVVEEALLNNAPDYNIAEAHNALARLREREAQLERERDGAELMLRDEREQHKRPFKADPVPWRDRAEAAEARVAELEQSNKTIIKEDGVVVSRQARKIARLEEALREIAGLTSMATPKEGSPVSYARGPQIARRALAHEEEMFSGRLDEVEMLPPGVTVQEHYNRGVAHEEECDGSADCKAAVHIHGCFRSLAHEEPNE